MSCELLVETVPANHGLLVYFDFGRLMDQFYL